MGNDAAPRDGWATNGGIRLHFLERRPVGAAGAVPLLFVPGTFGSAEDYIPEMAALSPRRCVAVSLRGRGRSDVPAAGYSFEDHVSDLGELVAVSGLDRFGMMAYSMGVPWALGYALRQPERVAGLILGDYPARYRALAPGWVERAMAALPDRATPVVASALQRDSSAVDLWARLGELRCPVLVLRGGLPGSMVTEEVAEKYRQHLPAVRIATLPQNGHEIWKPDFDAYVGEIGSFLEHVDTTALTRPPRSPA